MDRPKPEGGDDGGSAEQSADQLKSSKNTSNTDAAEALQKGMKNSSGTNANGQNKNGRKGKGHHLEFKGSIERFRVPLQPRASGCGTRQARGIG
jgi:hypothetical protein